MNERRKPDPEMMFEITVERIEATAGEMRRTVKDLKRVIGNWLFVITALLVVIAVGVWL